jgi:eukaryotic-like serine/threonine-protein kinase
MPVVPLEPDDPHVLGRYRLVGRLGEGGQGIVFLGEDEVGRHVAIKVLKTGADQRARERLAREMISAQRVAPFCTARVLESSVDGSRPFVVSEFVDGPSVQQRVAEHGPLREGELDRLVVGTATALTAIHGAGIIHRDLKPANVLLGPDGPRVVDFGIARAIDAGTLTGLVGTPAYFAPEQLREEPPTPASDVFAWAATMVFASTGRAPFGQDTIPSVLNRIAHFEPDLRGVPPQLHGLLAECLEKDPARRPTARALLVRLVDPSAGVERHVGGEVAQAAGQALNAPVRPNAPYPESLPAAMGQGPGTTRAPFGPPTSPGSFGAGSASRPVPARQGRSGLLLAALAGALIVAVGGGVGVWLFTGSGKTGARAQSSAPSVIATESGSAPAAGPLSGAAIPAAFKGIWTGSVTQPAGALSAGGTSSLTMIFGSGTSPGLATYTSWDCKTILQVTSASPAVLEIQESVSPGSNASCVGGRITLTLKDGALAYVSPGLDSSVTGTLRKQG